MQCAPRYPHALGRAERRRQSDLRHASLYNAARYARRDIRVSFNTHDGVNQLFVDDDGPGIPEQDRHRALESFVQLEQSSGKKAGFGLGLAIVKRAIEWHSGEVIISRSPLGGARISATWPAILPTPPVRAPFPH